MDTSTVHLIIVCVANALHLMYVATKIERRFVRIEKDVEYLIRDVGLGSPRRHTDTGSD